MLYERRSSGSRFDYDVSDMYSNRGSYVSSNVPSYRSGSKASSSDYSSDSVYVGRGSTGSSSRSSVSSYNHTGHHSSYNAYTSSRSGTGATGSYVSQNRPLRLPPSSMDAINSIKTRRTTPHAYTTAGVSTGSRFSSISEEKSGREASYHRDYLDGSYRSPTASAMKSNLSSLSHRSISSEPRSFLDSASGGSSHYGSKHLFQSSLQPSSSSGSVRNAVVSSANYANYTAPSYYVQQQQQTPDRAPRPPPHDNVSQLLQNQYHQTSCYPSSVFRYSRGYNNSFGTFSSLEDQQAKQMQQQHTRDYANEDPSTQTQSGTLGRVRRILPNLPASAMTNGSANDTDAKDINHVAMYSGGIRRHRNSFSFDSSQDLRHSTGRQQPSSAVEEPPSRYGTMPPIAPRVPPTAMSDQEPVASLYDMAATTHQPLLNGYAGKRNRHLDSGVSTGESSSDSRQYYRSEYSHRNPSDYGSGSLRTTTSTGSSGGDQDSLDGHGGTTTGATAGGSRGLDPIASALKRMSVIEANCVPSSHRDKVGVVPPAPPPPPNKTSSSTVTVARSIGASEDGDEVGSGSSIASRARQGRLAARLNGGKTDESAVPPPSAARQRSTTTSTTTADVDEKSNYGLVGLRNLGNTCFMNCILQCLSNTKVLLKYCTSNAYAADIGTGSGRSLNKGALMKSFAEMLAELWSKSSGYVAPQKFNNQIQKFAPRFISYSQQDAQEFLRYLLLGIHEDINRVTGKPKLGPWEGDNMPDTQKAEESWKRYLKIDNSKIVDLFVGQLKSELKCSHCDHVSVTFDPFWDLSLPIPSAAGRSSVSLVDCFDTFTKEETLDGDEKPTCEVCKTARRCFKKFSIYRFPQILVLHLKRFSGERYRSRLSTLVDFPISGLDLKPYGSKSTKVPSYDCYGIANHLGTPVSGHYTAYCRHATSDNNWFLYDDTRVSSVSQSSVVTSGAYVLFYESTAG